MNRTFEAKLFEFIYIISKESSLFFLKKRSRKYIRKTYFEKKPEEKRVKRKFCTRKEKEKAEFYMMKNERDENKEEKRVKVSGVLKEQHHH